MTQTALATTPTADSAPVVTIGANFSGAAFHTDPTIAFTPPDTDGAAGPTSFVELLNNLYQVYDKSGSLLQVARLPDFWTSAGVTLSGLPFDPRILYDPVSERWFATSSENPFIPNDILVAVSHTSDPTQGWQGFAIPSDSSQQTWADFPTLGINQDGVYIAANMYFANTSAFASEEIIAIPKSDLLQATPTVANATVFADVSPTDTGFSPHPVVAYQESGSEPLLSAGTSSAFSNSLKVTSIDPPIATPSLNVADRLVGIVPESDVTTATQKGTNVLLDLRSTSQFGSSVVLEDGRMFAVQGVQQNGLAALRWFVIGDPLNSPTILDSGVINPPDLNVYDGSIAVNALGDVVIGFTGSGPNDYPSAFAVVGTLDGDQLSMGDPILLKAGDGPYLGTDGEQGAGATVVRWGDYSTTTVDPSNPLQFWTTQEWAAADPTLTTVWSTQITELVFAPPPPTVQTWFGGTGNFSDAQNWSPAGSPAATDTLVIEAGRVRADHLTIANPTIRLGSPTTTPTLVLNDATLAATTTIRVETATFDPSQPDVEARIRVSGPVTEDGAIDIGATVDSNQPFPAHLTVSMASGSTLTLDSGAVWLSSDCSTLDVKAPEQSAELMNNGTVEALGGTVRMNAAVAGQGVFDVLFDSNTSRAGTLEFGEYVAAGQTVNLQSGLLKLDEPREFLGSIDGFNPDSTIELAHTSVTSADYSNGVLTLFDRHRIAAELHIDGNFTTDQFVLANHDGNTFVTLDPSGQMAQFTSAMASHAVEHGVTAPPQAQDESPLQSVLAPAWHS
ncbi:MAG: hypothetical protein JOY64_31760 [Alphaproteobacteria bacterium]|nr:hypothetical protein [Alphaproteobacteria bacterium]